MIHSIAVSGYRSLKDIVLGLGQLNLITGPNGSGKSNIYRSLRLLASLADGQLIQSLAKEGGLRSTLWAGPQKLSSAELAGKAIPQGKAKGSPVALKIGFTSDEFSYAIDLGLPIPNSHSAFGLDPVIKRECLWRSHDRSARNMCADRRSSNLRIRPERKWQDVALPFEAQASMLTEFADPVQSPELILTRDMIRDWRFYDQFRTDADAPSRRVEIGTFTPVLADDGAGLAAALQTIREIGNAEALNQAIENAFPGSVLRIDTSGGRFEIMLDQSGMLRPLRAGELSDGTLRYLFLCAALLSPRPPQLMILNEPETSLHPELLPALATLILSFASSNQIVVVTHAKPLINELSKFDQCVHFELEKVAGMTVLSGVNPLDIPYWEWPSR